MKKYAKIIDNQTQQCDVALGRYIPDGFVEMEVEEAYNGDWYVTGYAPVKPAPTKEEVSAIRHHLYVLESDPLKYDYEECLARYGEGNQQTVDAKNIWLAKKDEIRASNPYPAE